MNDQLEVKAYIANYYTYNGIKHEIENVINKHIKNIMQMVYQDNLLARFI